MAKPLGVNIISTFNSKGITQAVANFKALQGAAAKTGFALQTVDAAAKKMAASLARIGFGTAIIGGLAVRSFAQFDDAMNQSLAIMGDVSDEMKVTMSDAAKQMAKETTFSATDAAKSFYYLASAGLDAGSSVMALPKVAKFAQAGMFDMALATDLLTDAQSALGLTIRNDAVANMNNMVRVSDVLVKANTLANASVEQFSSALTNKAGAAMKSVGMDIEEGVAVLAAFADQGIKAEEGGTAFGMVLRDLQTKALQNNKAFTKYNVTVFDGAGELRNMGDIVKDVEVALNGKSDAVKKATLLEMGFADKSIAAMLALMGTSDAIKGYEAKLRAAGGTTEEVASKQLTSLSSQLKLARNAVVEIAMSLGQYLAPMVRGAAIVLQQFRTVVGEDGVGAGLQFLIGRIIDATFFGSNMGKAFAAIVSTFVAIRVASTAYSAALTIQKIITIATTKATKQQTVAMAEARVAAIAAGTALAVIAVAATAYMVYTKRKSEAKKATLDFVAALKLEGSAQDSAIADLYKSDKNWRSHIDTMGTLGIKMSELDKFIETGTGSVATLAETWDTATAGVKGIYPQLDAFSKAMGFAEGTTRHQVAEVRNMIQAFVIARGETQNNITTQIGLAKAMGNTVLAAQLLARQFGLDPTIPQFRDDAQAAAETTDALAAELQALLDSLNKTGGAVKTVTEKMKDYKDSVKNLWDAKISLVDASQSVADAEQKVKDAIQSTADALRNITKASRSVETAQRSYVKAQKSVTAATTSAAESVLYLDKAQNKLAAATQKTTNAQKALDEAVNGYGARSKQGLDAQDKLTQAQLDAEGSQYDLEKAQFAVTDAETELTNIRKDAKASLRDIREAEISLAEAKISLVESQRRQTETQNEVTNSVDQYDQMLNGVKTDSEIYKDLLGELNDAKSAERDATDAVTESMQKQQEAQVAINDALIAEEEAKLAVEEAEISLTKAKRDFAKAQLDEAAATRDVARARLNEAAATIAQAEAQERLNKARRDAGKAVVNTGNKQLAPYIESAKVALDATQKAYTASQHGGLIPFAKGGIVTSPTAALIGESGAEAVIPLDKMNQGMTVNVNITAGMGANANEIGNEIVNVLQRYNRMNGALPLKVA